jgi:hypothetical protein
VRTRALAIAAAAVLVGVIAVRVASDRSDSTTEAGRTATTTARLGPLVPAAPPGDASTSRTPATSTGGATGTTTVGSSATTRTGSASPTTGTPRTTAATAAASNTCPPVPPRATPAANRPKYRMRVDVDLAANAVDGDVTVRFTPDTTTDRLVFRLWPDGPRPRAGGAHLETGSVFVDGVQAEARRTDATTLVVRTGRPFSAGTTVAVDMPWRLTLPGSINDRISRSGTSVRLGSFFPILAWEPGVGWGEQPATSGFAEASVAPVADFDVRISVPAGLGALATGVYDGQGRWTATAVRDFALSIGNFRVATGTARAPDAVKVTVGVAAGVDRDPATFLAKEIRVLEDFGNRFGPYPYPELTLAITPGLNGGIEYPGHIMQGPDTISRTTSHEVGHMWFYALVGNHQGRDPWLDEGVTSWAEAMFENALGSFRSQSIPAGARGHVGEPMTYWEPRQDVYYRGVYVQGVQALAAAGEPGLVDCALRHYVARNAYRIARPGDLLDALELVLPGASARMAPYGARR